MKPEKREFLNLERLPATVDAEGFSFLTDFAPFYVPLLIAKGLLKPLGGRNVPRNSTKRFCTAEILALCQDRSWLDKCQKAILEFNQTRNGKGSESNTELQQELQQF